MNRKKLPKGWTGIPLGEVITLEYGKSFPEKRRRSGPYAVYGSNGIVGRAHEYLLEEATVIVGRKGSAGEINYGEPKSWPIDTTYYVQLKNGKVNSLDFVYYLLKWLDPRNLVDTTTKPGLNRDRAYEQIVPLMPLPVQERIVQILQKADEIRRKRQEALELIDNVLVSLFHEMFGDPESHPVDYDVLPLAELVKDKNGIKCGPFGSQLHISELQSSGIPVLGIENVEVNRFIDTKNKFVSPKKFEQLKSFQIYPGDVLITRTGTSGRACIVPNSFPQAIIGPNLLKVSPNPDKLLPEVLSLAINFNPSIIHQIKRSSPGSTVAVFNVSNLKRILFTVPPIGIQESFLNLYRKIAEQKARLSLALETSENQFVSILSRAFTGELTAEWEAASAKEIGKHTAFHEHLPRLLILALLAEKAKRIRKKATDVFVTALMKYVFLFQMEGNGHRRLYHFVPYHYGPFAKELYADLEKLQGEGLISVENDAEAEKTRITLVDFSKAEKMLSELPDDLREDAATIIDTYGELDHNALLKAVYEKYPTYAKKSRLRRGRSVKS